MTFMLKVLALVVAVGSSMTNGIIVNHVQVCETENLQPQIQCPSDATIAIKNATFVQVRCTTHGGRQDMCCLNTTNVNTPTCQLDVEQHEPDLYSKIQRHCNNRSICAEDLHFKGFMFNSNSTDLCPLWPYNRVTVDYICKPTAEKNESRCALYEPEFYTKPLCEAGSVIQLDSARLEQWHYILNQNPVPHCSYQPAPQKANVSHKNSCDQKLGDVNNAEPSYYDVVKSCDGQRTCWGVTAQEVTVDKPPEGCKTYYQQLHIDYNCESVNVTKLKMGKTQEEQMCEPDMRVELKGAMFGSNSCDTNGLCGGAKMCLVSIQEVDQEYYNTIKKTCDETNCHGLVTKNYTCGESDQKGCHFCNWKNADYIVLDWVCKNTSEGEHPDSPKGSGSDNGDHSRILWGVVVGAIVFIIIILASITVVKLRKRRHLFRDTDEISFSSAQLDPPEKVTEGIQKQSISDPIPYMDNIYADPTEPLQSKSAPQKPPRTFEENNASLQRMTQRPPNVPDNDPYAYDTNLIENKMYHQSPSKGATDDQEEYAYTTVKPPLSQKPNQDQSSKSIVGPIDGELYSVANK